VTDTLTTRVRRSPPPFLRAAVTDIEPINSRLTRVTLTGPDLDGLVVTEPGASIRLLLPPADATELVIPTWRGNEFLLPDDQKPAIRTFTPSLIAPGSRTLVLDIVRHGQGVASDWAARAHVGDATAVSGPGRGYTVDPAASDYLVAGDETALPAIRQLLDALPWEIPAVVFIETAAADARIELLHGSDVTIEWLPAAPHDTPDATPGTALADAVIAAPTGSDTRVWVAGEAAAVQRVRRHLFTERDFPRERATIRGYWKHGRAGTPEQ
jgi:NADPH-dependent ferric siderophore reductase